MSHFLDSTRSLPTYCRAVILFGKNVASHKFALAQSLVELAAEQKTFVALDELALRALNKNR